MKKVPSYPKITSKTNITVTHTQNININSPKAAILKKGFKNQKNENKSTKISNIHKIDKNVSPPLKVQSQKQLQQQTKSSKKSTVPSKDLNVQKSIKNSTSQRQLAMLSEKLKRLQEKMKKIKQKQKQKDQKNTSASHRSLSKNNQNNSYAKRQATSSRKQLNIVTKYHIPKAQSHKILKKSQSGRIQVYSSNLIKHKKHSAIKNSKISSEKQQKKRKISDQKHDEQVLHKFVTQVPNSHQCNLKQGVQKSLANKYYAITPSSSSEEQDSSMQSYYVSKAIKCLNRPALYLVRQHLIQSIQTLQFLQNVKRPSHKQIQKKHIQVPPSKFRHTIVLDLDQTLIHCNESLNLPHDIKLNIKFPTGQKIDAGINIRPFATQFLTELSKICQVVVFTASHQCYATVVLDYLDPKKHFISHRLFREHCWQTEQGIYIKDLRVIKNRSLDNIILVDNAAYSYYFQLQNGVPIVPYYDDKGDQELATLLLYIKQVISKAQKSSTTIKKLNQKYFRLGQYSKFQDIAPLVQQLYTTNSSSYA